MKITKEDIGGWVLTRAGDLERIVSIDSNEYQDYPIRGKRDCWAAGGEWRVIAAGMASEVENPGDIIRFATPADIMAILNDVVGEDISYCLGPRDDMREEQGLPRQFTGLVES